VLSLVLASAVKDSRLVRNPAEGISLPRVVVTERRYLTHAQVAELAEACACPRPDLISKHRRHSERRVEEYKLIVLFLAYTGVRFGELAALCVGRLDLLRRRATIAESVTEVQGRAVFSTPKTHQSRSVPIPRFLADALAAHVAGKGPSEFVFSAPHGGVLRARNFRRAAFDPAARSVGLAGLHPHELRHTSASLAIASGANVKVVQQILGHKSATMTLDLYGHLFGDQLDEIADRLDAARGAGVAPLLPERKLINLDSARDERAAQQIRGL
jgi:integrase